MEPKLIHQGFDFDRGLEMYKCPLCDTVFSVYECIEEHNKLLLCPTCRTIFEELNKGEWAATKKPTPETANDDLLIEMMLYRSCIWCKRSRNCLLKQKLAVKPLSLKECGIRDLSEKEAEKALEAITFRVICEHFLTEAPHGDSVSDYFNCLPCDTCEFRPHCSIAVAKSFVDEQAESLRCIDKCLKVKVLCSSYEPQPTKGGNNR